eukprot:2935-Eustigmatos_ZCMA.PRE.1
MPFFATIHALLSVLQPHTYSTSAVSLQRVQRDWSPTPTRQGLITPSCSIIIHDLSCSPFRTADNTTYLGYMIRPT